MIDKLKTHYIVVCLIILGLSAFLDYQAQNIELVSKSIKMIDAKGSIVQSDFLASPPLKRILDLLSTFFYTLSASIFIAVFVTNRIESSQREKEKLQLTSLRDAINENVFDSLFKTLIPDELFRTIKEEVIENKVVRRDDVWLYDFFKLSDTEVELRQTIKNNLYNVGRNTINHPLKITTFSKTDNVVGIESINCEMDGKTCMTFDIHDIKNSIGVETIEEGDRKFYLCMVEIPPQRTVEMTLVIRTKYTIPIRDAYFIRYPVINATLIVNIPHGFDFDLFSSFSSNLRATIKKPTQHMYTINGGVLPHQGFIFFLTKRDPQIEQKNV